MRFQGREWVPSRRRLGCWLGAGDGTVLRLLGLAVARFAETTVEPFSGGGLRANGLRTRTWAELRSTRRAPGWPRWAWPPQCKSAFRGVLRRGLAQLIQTDRLAQVSSTAPSAALEDWVHDDAGSDRPALCIATPDFGDGRACRPLTSLGQLPGFFLRLAGSFVPQGKRIVAGRTDTAFVSRTRVQPQL